MHIVGPRGQMMAFDEYSENAFNDSGLEFRIVMLHYISCVPAHVTVTCPP